MRKHEGYDDDASEARRDRKRDRDSWREARKSDRKRKNAARELIDTDSREIWK